MFNPASPLNFTGGVGGSATVTASEGNYGGGFSVTGCSSTTATCSQSSNVWICSLASNGGTHSVINVNPGNAQNQFLVSYGSANAPTPAYSCTFTISDQLSHTAQYVVNVSAQ
jgi:hypothetical protein